MTTTTEFTASEFKVYALVDRGVIPGAIERNLPVVSDRLVVRHEGPSTGSMLISVMLSSHYCVGEWQSNTLVGTQYRGESPSFSTTYIIPARWN